MQGAAYYAARGPETVHDQEVEDQFVKEFDDERKQEGACTSMTCCRVKSVSCLAVLML